MNFKNLSLQKNGIPSIKSYNFYSSMQSNKWSSNQTGVTEKELFNDATWTSKELFNHVYAR